MTKKKKLLSRNIIIASVAVLLVAGVGVMANQSLRQMIANRIGDNLTPQISKELSSDVPAEENLGGSGGVFQTDWVKQGNRVTFIKSGQFADAATMLFSIPNPFGGGTATSTNDEDYNDDTHRLATSTVASINLDVTGVSTSTMGIICGGAADSSSAPTYDLLNLTLPTSTKGVFNNNQATTTDGLGAIGTGSANQILLTHDFSHFNCIATGTPASLDSDWATVQKGVTGDTNTFDGYWSVEVQKNLQ